MNVITLKEMKQIIYEILEEESRLEHLNVSIYPCTYIEYYSSSIFRKMCKLSNKKQLFTLPLKASGINLRGKKDVDRIVIFLTHKKINPNFDTENQFIYAIYNTYHEIQHSLQWKRMQEEPYSYDAFLYSIEDTLIQQAYPFYIKNHNSFLIELESNLYAINKTKQYLEQRGLFNKRNQQIIERLRDQLTYAYISYDPQFIFEKWTEIIKYKLPKLNGQYEWWSSIYDEEGNMKKASEILEDIPFQKFNKGIQYMIISSQDFMKNMDIKNMNNDEKQIILSALQYTYENYMSQLSICHSYNNQPKNKQILEYLHELVQQKNILLQSMDMNQFVKKAKYPFHKSNAN